MAAQRKLTAERPGSLVHLPRTTPAVEELVDPRLSDVDEWGRSEHMRALARTRLRPALPALVPRRVGGAREDPDRRRRAARGQPRRRHPVRRAGDHARHRDRAASGPSTAWPTTSSRRMPVVGTLWSRHRRRGRPPRQRLPAAARAAAARARLPRGHQGPGQDLQRALPAAPLRPRRLRRDRHARRRADRAHRRGRRRGVDADRVQDRRRWPRRSALPYFPITANMLRFGPARAPSPTSRPSSSCGCSTRCTSTCRPTRSATRGAGSWTSPRTIRQQIQEALYDMLRDRRSVWFG